MPSLRFPLRARGAPRMPSSSTPVDGSLAIDAADVIDPENEDYSPQSAVTDAAPKLVLDTNAIIGALERTKEDHPQARAERLSEARR